MASGGVHLVAGFALGTRCSSASTALMAGIASHAVLDATQRAGRRVIADDEEHGIGCQISNMLKRVA